VQLHKTFIICKKRNLKLFIDSFWLLKVKSRSPTFLFHTPKFRKWEARLSTPHYVELLRYTSFGWYLKEVLNHTAVKYAHVHSSEQGMLKNLVKNSTYFGQIYCPSSGVLILYSQQ